MPRVKRGTVRRAKRKKLLGLAKGYYANKSKLYRAAKESVDTALKYAFVGRRRKKRPGGRAPTLRVKKIAGRFERETGPGRHILVGAETPPQQLYPARAPIHPKRPYGSTRPVVPPDGSFISGMASRRKMALPWRVARKMAK